MYELSLRADNWFKCDSGVSQENVLYVPFLTDGMGLAVLSLQGVLLLFVCRVVVVRLVRVDVVLDVSAWVLTF